MQFPKFAPLQCIVMQDVTAINTVLFNCSTFAMLQQCNDSTQQWQGVGWIIDDWQWDHSEEPPFINLARPDHVTGKCNVDRGIRCRVSNRYVELRKIFESISEKYLDPIRKIFRPHVKICIWSAGRVVTLVRRTRGSAARASVSTSWPSSPRTYSSSSTWCEWTTPSGALKWWGNT